MKRSNYEVELLSTTQPFSSKYDKDLLLQNTVLISYLDIIEVKDHEIAVQYLNGNFNKVLTSGRQVFGKGLRIIL